MGTEGKACVRHKMQMQGHSSCSPVGVVPHTMLDPHLLFCKRPGGTRQGYFIADDLSAFVRAPAQTLCGALPRTCESVGLATYNKRRRGGLWS